MNRRGFILKALAGLTAVPLLGKLTQAKPQSVACPVGQLGPQLFPPPRFAVCEGSVYRVLSLTLNRSAIDPFMTSQVFVNGESHEVIEWQINPETVTLTLRPDRVKQLVSSASSSTTV